jgi:hypothetical protein
VPSAAPTSAPTNALSNLTCSGECSALGMRGLRGAAHTLCSGSVVTVSQPAAACSQPECLSAGGRTVESVVIGSYLYPLGGFVGNAIRFAGDFSKSARRHALHALSPRSSH